MLCWTSAVPEVSHRTPRIATHRDGITRMAQRRSEAHEEVSLLLTVGGRRAFHEPVVLQPERPLTDVVRQGEERSVDLDLRAVRSQGLHLGVEVVAGVDLRRDDLVGITERELVG